MNAPLVSICLPNLNTLPYLRERVDTILAQTYTNWELIVSDNYSEDGAWSFFETLARQDSRVSIAQAPRRGMYENWNQCVRRARGEYIYIATSDDGMAPDCLEQLVAALERHEDCDVAHCPLRVVDAAGAPLRGHRAMQEGLLTRSTPELVDQVHVRRAPYDGMLCLLREHVYYSITEMLYRRSLFSRVGEFETRWGSASDFQWHMRVGLVASTVHVPDTWATWRVHPQQATPAAITNWAEHIAKVEDMIQDALRRSERLLDPAIFSGIRSYWLDWSRDMDVYYSGLRNRPNVLEKRLFQLSQVVAGPRRARREILRRLAGRPKWPDAAPVEMRRWLESLGYVPLVSFGRGQKCAAGRQSSETVHAGRPTASSAEAGVRH
jgi:glycosyltransferase involved in cell wall biosynthesis